jgi:uncharacterized membrane protein (UPF0127 family)
MKVGNIYRRGAADPLLPQVWYATDPASRLRGLLGRPALVQAHDGLLLSPCNAVHTFGMAYPLDLVFLDQIGRVLDIAANVRPWRCRRCRGARQTLELAAGSLAVLGIRPGDELIWIRTAAPGSLRPLWVIGLDMES